MFHCNLSSTWQIADQLANNAGSTTTLDLEHPDKASTRGYLFTYCRWGVSITEDMNIGRFLIWRLNPKTAFCWKPSLMLRIYWFWSVMNRTSLRPLELASSISFTTGCGGEEMERKKKEKEREEISCVVVYHFMLLTVLLSIRGRGRECLKREMSVKCGAMFR